MLGFIYPAITSNADVVLTTPGNVSWMEGSTATATWDPVDGANYYNIYISAYDSSDGLIGSQSTGTTECSIDVQDVIRAIDGVSGYNSVTVKFQIQAVYQEDGVDKTTSSLSSESAPMIYSLTAMDKYAAPTGVSFDEENLTVSFDLVDGATEYDVAIFFEDDEWGETWLVDRIIHEYDGEFIDEGVTVSDGIVTVDFTSAIPGGVAYLINSFEDKYGTEWELYSKVRVLTTDPSLYADSDYSDPSNTINYKYQIATAVESIMVSPSSPYVPAGGTYSLGKTITPINAYNVTLYAKWTAVATPTLSPKPTVAPTPTATPTPAPVSSTEFLVGGGQAHVQDIGDTPVSVDPDTGILTIGTTGQGKRLEEILINFENTTGYSGTMMYRVHVQDYGWLPWTEAGKPAGTEHESKRIEAIEIVLTGELAKYYSVEYCVHIQDYGDMQGWVHDGALAGTTGESKRIEEIKVMIVPKDSSQTMSVMYRVHVQDYGWEKSYSSDGQMAGTSGESKRLEGYECAGTCSRRESKCYHNG